MRTITKSSLILTAALALPAAVLPTTSASAQVGFGIFVNFGLPPLSWYPQPLCPGPGYLWVPGYWAWGPYGYFWVPGAWIWPPRIGFLWTPGYWYWRGGYYWWRPGYWGPRVGFYGGIRYGYGYPGRGYYGGYWRRGRFHYNLAVANVNPGHGRLLAYNESVRPAAQTARRISYNGGPGGIALRPTRGQQASARERSIGPTAVQTKERQTALNDHALRLADNGNRPAVVSHPMQTPAGTTPMQHKTNRPQTSVNRGEGNNPAARPNLSSHPFKQPQPQAMPNPYSRTERPIPEPAWRNRGQPRNEAPPPPAMRPQRFQPYPPSAWARPRGRPAMPQGWGRATPFRSARPYAPHGNHRPPR